MKRKLVSITILFILFAAVSTTVWAGFGSNSSATKNSIDVTVETKGDWDTLLVSMAGTLTSTCVNKGTNEPPGQKNFVVNQSLGSTSQGRERGDNVYVFSFGDPSLGCPNGKFTEVVVGDLMISLTASGTNGRTVYDQITCHYDSTVPDGTELSCDHTFVVNF
jgi:hypothetical protein